MRVGRIIPKTMAEGPGCRFCLWVQGCHHHCEGCFAEDLHPYDGGYEVGVDEILAMLDAVKGEIEGVTLLGGEPFDKASDLAEIAAYAKALDKTVIAFTGYTYEALTLPNQRKLLRYTDVLIDGEFVLSQQDFSRPLVGSSNQRILFLTDAIDRNTFFAYRNRFEVRTDESGKVTFNGMGDINKLRELLATMGE